MTTRDSWMVAAAAALLAAPAVAQETQLAANIGVGARAADSTAATETDEGTSITPAGARGLNTFEGKKFSDPFDGLKIGLGGAFTVGFQALDHSNTATPRLVDGADANAFGEIRPGFLLPTANLNLNVQLAPGINMVLESYMSSRHHNEFWVKGGYATIDQSPVNLPALNRLFQYTTVRAGMYEPFYGDAIYRRSDNGNTLQNPFAENFILDAFTTEPGMDVIFRVGDAFAMVGATSGQNKGDIRVNRHVDGSEIRARPALYGKLGVDRQISDLLRVRLSGSAYAAESSPSSTLYGGDRTGSAYWGVLEDVATLKGGKAFTNGRLNPGFRNEITAYQLNPFIKLGGLELFGVIEQASGKAFAEPVRRDVSQYVGDAVYRFLGDRLYVGGRYNVVRGDLAATLKDISVERKALAAGWFISPNMLTKVEYVTQQYDGFPATHIMNGAEFSGVVIQGSIAF